jgi:hypothetical protein
MTGGITAGRLRLRRKNQIAPRFGGREIACLARMRAGRAGESWRVIAAAIWSTSFWVKCQCKMLSDRLRVRGLSRFD